MSVIGNKERGCSFSRHFLFRDCLAVVPLAISLELFVGIPLHETAHFLVAKLVGGKPAFTAWHRVTVQPGLSVWSYALVALAGPATSILVGWRLFIWGRARYLASAAWQVSAIEARFRRFLLVLIVVFGGTMVFTGAWNLVPLPQSDGSVIFRVLLRG